VLAFGLIALAPRSAQAASPAIPPATPAATAVITAARTLLGAPYAYIGDDPATGFSCIGFVHYVFGRIGVYVPYNLDLAYAAGPRVHGSLQPGDLVFFSNTVWKGLSHVALYAGDDEVIGADNFATGVELTHLSSPYWAAHYTGATRPLADITVPLRPIVEPPPAPAPAVTVHAGQLLSGGTTGDVYSGPGYGYQRIDRLAPRVSLRVVRVAAPWADVSYRGSGSDYYGWVDSSYLAGCRVMAPPASRPTRPTAQRTARPTAPGSLVVTAAALFLRGGPSTGAPILGTLAHGQRVMLLERRGGWDRVRADARTGWAYARWLAPQN
jgi:uncharacterized protein YraI